MRGWTTYRLFDLVAKRAVVRKLHELLERQAWSPERLASHRRERLALLLEHARSHVPFYEELELPAGELELSAFPLLDKRTLARDGKRLLARRSRREEMRAVSSGGSTGEPVRLWLDRGTLDAQSAATLRHQTWMGLPLVCRHVLLWGPPPDQVSYGRTGGRLRGAVLRRRFFPTYGLEHDDAAGIRDWLRANPVEKVEGYSSALDLVAHGAAPLEMGPRAVLAAAEPLFEPQRRRIAGYFGTRVFARYGCNEFAAIAHECERGSWHVNSDRVVLEILRGDGSPAADGEIGEAVVTDLDNLGMPLIRFRLGDALAAGGACDCGLPFPTIAGVHGRMSDLIAAPGGKRVTSSSVAEALDSAGEVREHQVVVGSDGRPRSVVVRPFGEFDTDAARRALGELLGGVLEVSRVATPLRWPSGKVRPVRQVEAER